MRFHFGQLSKDESHVIKLKELAAQSHAVHESTRIAYYAAAEMSAAQYKINPASKLKLFNSGKQLLEKCVEKDSLNIEIRYIRYTIQTQVPGFLGYNKQINNDRFYLIQNLNPIRKKDTELFANIYAYLHAYGKLTETEKKLING